MSKSRAYVILINIAKANAGVIDLASPEVQTFLGITPKTPKGRAYRLPSYIWDIKHYASLDVKAVRQGRKVVQYILPAFTPGYGLTVVPETPAYVIEAENPDVVTDAQPADVVDNQFDTKQFR